MDTVPTPPRRDPAADADDFARDAQAYMEDLLNAKLAAGRTYSTLDADGNVVHVHPDGSVRPTRARSA